MPQPMSASTAWPELISDMLSVVSCLGQLANSTCSKNPAYAPDAGGGGGGDGGGGLLTTLKQGTRIASNTTSKSLPAARCVRQNIICVGPRSHIRHSAGGLCIQRRSAPSLPAAMLPATSSRVCRRTFPWDRRTLVIIAEPQTFVVFARTKFY